MAGNIGSEQRVEYTALGDTTNTASRLEGMTKGSGHMLFVAHSTRERMKDPPEQLVLVGELEVRGRVAKLPVWTLAGRRQWSARRAGRQRPGQLPRPVRRHARLGERQARGGVAGHAVHRPPGERGGAAEVEAAHRRAVGGERGHRPEDHLAERVAAAADVAADEVRVAALQIAGAEHVAREDPLAKAGREALDLRLDALDVALALALPVDRVRTVRVGPGGVPPAGARVGSASDC